MQKESYTLIIVDMQPTLFEAAQNQEATKACAKAIKKAIKNNNNIIFVEWKYTYPGNKTERFRSAESLLKLIKNYKRAHFVYKYQCDGSSKLKPLLLKKSFAKKVLKICGVNTQACVLATAQGLGSKFPASEIHLLTDACYDACSGSWVDKKEYTGTIKNILITKA